MWHVSEDPNPYTPAIRIEVAEGEFPPLAPGKPWKIMSDEQFNSWIELKISSGWTPEYTNPNIVVPQSIASWRGKYMLKVSGFEAKVIATLNAMSAPEGPLARLAYQEGADFERNGEFVNLLIRLVDGLTDEIADQLFIAGANLSI